MREKRKRLFRTEQRAGFWLSAVKHCPKVQYRAPRVTVRVRGRSMRAQRYARKIIYARKTAIFPGEPTMGPISPEMTLALVVAAAIVVMLIALLGRRSPSSKTPNATPVATSQTPPPAPAARPASAAPAQASIPQSYAAIAAAQAPTRATATAEPPPARIDYTGEPTNVAADASYAAIAVATAARAR